MDCELLIPVSLLFRCADGSAIAYAAPFTKLFYSPDGQTFVEVFFHSYSGPDLEHYLEFEMPGQGGLACDSCVYRLNDTLTVTNHPIVPSVQRNFMRDPNTAEVWVKPAAMTDEI